MSSPTSPSPTRDTEIPRSQHVALNGTSSLHEREEGYSELDRGGTEHDSRGSTHEVVVPPGAPTTEDNGPSSPTSPATTLSSPIEKDMTPNPLPRPSPATLPLHPTVHFSPHRTPGQEGDDDAGPAVEEAENEDDEEEGVPVPMLARSRSHDEHDRPDAVRRSVSYMASQAEAAAHTAIVIPDWRDNDHDGGGKNAKDGSTLSEEGTDTSRDAHTPPPDHHDSRDSTTSTTSTPGEQAVGVITLKVKKSKLKEFDKWVQEMTSTMEVFKGFVRRDRQDWDIDAKFVGISVLLTFATDADLLRWNASAERAAMIARGHKMGLYAERRAEIKDKALPFAEMTKFESSAAMSPLVLPPPKWKLWLVIWACVASASIAQSEAAVSAGLRNDNWLEFEPALFVQLSISVIFIVYAYSPLLTSVEIRGIGLARWLKLPRVKVSTRRGKRCLDGRIFLAGIIDVMNNGFSLFNPPPPDHGSPELQARIAKLEGRLDAFKRHTAARLLELDGDDTGPGRHDHHHSASRMHRPSQPHPSPLPGRKSEPAITVSEDSTENVRASIVDYYADKVLANLRPNRNPEEPVSITIHNRVKWECIEEFERWQIKIMSAMSNFPGYVSARRIVPARWDDNVYTTIFRFCSLETLSAWMHSEERIELLEQLQGLLETRDVLTASQDRHLPDVFTDVLVAQGEAASRRPPPKWKVVIIIIAALFITAWPLQVHMPRHLLRWGMRNRRAMVVVSTGFSTVINTYLTAPFFHNLFGYWLKLPVPEHFQRYPWKLLDVGLISPWSMAIVVFVFFLGCGLKIDSER
eukprot:m.169313 g.169313  ORF g.169313 m.169313 type:complete len:804 (-) comp13086_c0_seq1:43-2454(-)